MPLCDKEIRISSGGEWKLCQCIMPNPTTEPRRPADEIPGQSVGMLTKRSIDETEIAV